MACETLADINDLAADATCYLALSWSTRQAIRILNYCIYVNGEAAMPCGTQTEINDLAIAARCFTASLSAGQMDAIETMLSCQIASGGGGGGGGGDPQVFRGAYGGGLPGDVPTTSAAIAYDTDAPNNVWYWTGAAWGP